MTIQAVDPFQRYGYVKVYRYLVAEYNQSTAYVYGVMEWLAQISERNRQALSPSLEWIAKQADVSERTVQRSLGLLREGGWLDWKTEGRVNHYTVKRVHFDSVESSQIGHRLDETVAKMSTHGSQNVQLVRSTELETPEGDTPPMVPQDSVPSFDDLWAGYAPGKKGPKILARAVWDKLDDEAKRRAVAALPAWRQCRKWREGYVREAHRWLRYQEFDDEVPGGVEPRQGMNGKLAETEDLRQSVRYLREQAAGGTVIATDCPPDVGTSPLPAPLRRALP